MPKPESIALNVKLAGMWKLIHSAYKEIVAKNLGYACCVRTVVLRDMHLDVETVANSPRALK